MKRQTIRTIIISITAILFPLIYYFLSPYLILMGASQGIVTGSFIAFTLMFLSSLVVGRAFCGWVCPAGGLQEGCARLRGRPNKGGWRNYLKYLIWIPWVSLIVFTFITVGGFKRIDPLYQTWYGISITNVGSLILFIMIAGIITATALLWSRRAFCHSFCWMAPFMIIGARIKNLVKWPSLRLNADASRCVKCRTCTMNCTMSLPVDEMVARGDMRNDECILCGSCADSCPRKVIRLGVFPW